MNNYIFKRLFFTLILTIFILPLTASLNVDNPIPILAPPASPQHNAAAVTTPAPLQLDDQQISTLCELLASCIEQIQNVHTIFSTEHTTAAKKPIITIYGVKKSFDGLLNSVFAPLFQRNGVQFTPENVNALGTHTDDIKGDSSEDFLRKGDADFLKSVNPSNFHTVITHFGNTYFIPKWMIQPNKGFALRQKITLTLDSGIEYGECNVQKLLKGKNPASRSGSLEIHHTYQNQSTVTYLCRSEHKSNTKKYHKSERETLIDRVICATEFYLINKLTGLLQVAHMCEHVLDLVNYDLPENTTTLMESVRQYRGNITIIPNGAEIQRRKISGITEAFNLVREKKKQKAVSASSLVRKSSVGSEVLVSNNTENSDSESTVSELSSRRDSFASGITDRNSVDSDTDGNSRDSVGSSSSFEQQTRRVSISSAATDNLSSDEESPIARKKIVAKRDPSGRLQRSTSSVTQGVQEITTTDEASQKLARKKRNLTARKTADSKDPLISKENQGTHSPVKKKIVRGKGVIKPTILGTHNS